MNARQRVIQALDHQLPDRVPLAIWGGPYGIVDELYFKLLPLLGLSEPVAPFRQGHTINHIDDRVLKKLGSDIRYVWPGASPTSPRYPTDNPDVFLDGFDQKWLQTFPYFTATDGLLKQAHSISEIDELVNWPDTSKPEWTAGVAERARILAKEGEYYIAARMVVSHGPFQLACDLRGAAEFMLDMVMNPDFATALLDKITTTICGLTDAYMQTGGQYYDLIELPGDDYASNVNLIISPKMFRAFIKPCIKRMVETIRAHKSDIKIMLHSDGAIQKLIPDFIELGIDVLHPLEPVSGMDVAGVKHEFGQQIAFIGGVDISRVMPGSLQDVRTDVDRCIRDLAPNGGYIMAPCNHLQADVPPENVIEMFSYASERGRYK